MAFRINTVEYAWETNQSCVSGSVLYVAPVKRITIPETGSRTFLSVDFELYIRDASSISLINPTAFGLSCYIDGNNGLRPAAATITSTDDHQTLMFKENLTDHFNARFTGSVHDISPNWYISASAVSANIYTGHSFKMIATYQYNDSSVQTNIKTVKLPLDSLPNTLSTTQQVFGKNIGGYTNIPAFDTFLPESTKSYKDIWIEYTGYDTGAAATINLITQIDSGSETARFSLSGSLITDTHYFDIQNVSGTIDTSTAHTLKARSNIASRMSWISPTICATYTYRSDLTGTVMNSIMLPIYANSNINRVNQFEWISSFLIPERNPSLCHSAFILTPNVGVTTIQSIKINGVGAISSSFTRGSVLGSPVAVNCRFDGNAATSSNFSLISGYNKLLLSITSSNTQNDNYKEYSGYVLLNYSSSILESGIHGHTKTICFSTSSMTGFSGASFRRWKLYPTQSIHGDITSSFYSIGHNLKLHGNATSFGTVEATNGISVEMPSTSDIGAKWAYTSLPAYKNYPRQPITSIVYNNIYFASDDVAMSWPSVIRGASSTVYLTYNQNIIRVTGSLSNCNFTTTDYTVDVYLSGSDVPIAPIYNLTSSGSGATKTFMFDWYEGINKLYAVTKYPEIGISNLATASNGNILMIDYGTPASGEKSFTFIG